MLSLHDDLGHPALLKVLFLAALALAAMTASSSAGELRPAEAAPIAPGWGSPMIDPTATFHSRLVPPIPAAGAADERCPRQVDALVQTAGF